MGISGDLESDKSRSKTRDINPSSLLQVPRNPTPGDFVVYESEVELRRLMVWLNECGQREGPLRAALLRAFPEKKQVKACDSSASDPTLMDVEDSRDGKRNDRATTGSSNESGRDSGRGKNVRDSSVVRTAERVDGSGEEHASGNEGNQGSTSEEGQGGEVAGESAGAEVPSSSASRPRRGGRGGRGGSADIRKAVIATAKKSQELPRLLQEGGVELRIANNPPGAHGNVMAPSAEAVVEFDNDAEANDVRDRGNVLTREMQAGGE